MPDHLSQRRAERDRKREAFEQANQRIQAAAPTTTTAQLDSLQRDFESAEIEFTQAADAVEYHEQTTLARKVSGTSAPAGTPGVGCKRLPF